MRNWTLAVTALALASVLSGCGEPGGTSQDAQKSEHQLKGGMVVPESGASADGGSAAGKPVSPN